MTTIIGPLPNIISNGQVADAVPVMSDFNWIVNQVNANGAPNNVNFPLPASGSLINVQTIASTGLYTPTTGTNSVIMWLVGGGGAGGGCPATNASQNAISTGGGAGGLLVVRLLSGFTGGTVTVGAGGTGVVGAQGNAGGATTFAGYAAGGGGGGGISLATNTSASVRGTFGGSVAGSGLLLSSTGNPSEPSFILVSPTSADLVGNGGAGPFGGAGQSPSGSGAGPGSGGSGTVLGASQAAIAGPPGAAGICIIYEFA